MTYQQFLSSVIQPQNDYISCTCEQRIVSSHTTQSTQNGSLHNTKVRSTDSSQPRPCTCDNLPSGTSADRSCNIDTQHSHAVKGSGILPYKVIYRCQGLVISRDSLNCWIPCSWTSLLSQSLTDLLIHSLIYSFTHSFTHLLTYSLTHLLTYSLTHSLAHSFR